MIALKSEKRLQWHGPRRCAFYHIRRKKEKKKTNYLSPYSQIAPATSKKVSNLNSPPGEGAGRAFGPGDMYTFMLYGFLPKL